MMENESRFSFSLCTLFFQMATKLLGQKKKQNKKLRSERSPGGGNGNPLQYSCLESPRDRGAWRATVHRVALHTHLTA